ncbi:MAG: hypothetical protein JNL74_19305 [Fibrobacteres bacterium]|nr:hypothetical protein [Fibrobacterota bacterium]
MMHIRNFLTVAAFVVSTLLAENPTITMLNVENVVADTASAKTWKGSVLFSCKDKEHDSLAVTLKIAVGTDTFSIDSIWGEKRLIPHDSARIWFTFKPSKDLGSGTLNAKIKLTLNEHITVPQLDSSWFNDIWYMLPIDRFNDGDISNNVSIFGVSAANNFTGGDIGGLLSKIMEGYFDNLGITVLNISSACKNFIGSETTGTVITADWKGEWPLYDTSASVSAAFGTSSDFANLISEMHSNNMRLIMDYSARQVHISSPIYSSNPEFFTSKKIYGIDLPLPSGVTDGWFTSFLPAFNMSVDTVTEMTTFNLLKWLKYGIDGIRLDEFSASSLTWLNQFKIEAQLQAKACSLARPLISTRTMITDIDAAKQILNAKTGFDCAFDYLYRNQLCGTFLYGDISISDFISHQNVSDSIYSLSGLKLRGLGNDFTSRAINISNRDFHYNSQPVGQFTQPTNSEAYERMAVAFAVLFTGKGVPAIYYGDEIGLAGGLAPDNAKVMPFSNLSAHQSTLREKVAKLSQIRRNFLFIATGERRTLSVSTDTWSYSIKDTGGSDSIIVAINRGNASSSITLPVGSYTNYVSMQNVIGGVVNIPPRSYLILK